MSVPMWRESPHAETSGATQGLFYRDEKVQPAGNGRWLILHNSTALKNKFTILVLSFAVDIAIDIVSRSGHFFFFISHFGINFDFGAILLLLT